MTRVVAFWGRLNSSFWFVPTVMTVVAVALSFLLIEVDAYAGWIRPTIQARSLLSDPREPGRSCR